MYVRSAQSWVLMAVVLLAACDLRPRTGTGVDNPVTQVVVYPDTLTLDPQQSYQFRVFGRTQAGDSVPVSVRWAASAGSISASGVYTADTSAADAIVTATLANSTVSGSSNVKKRRVVRVIIDPKNTTLSVGGVQVFSAYGRRNTGDSVSVSVTYSATGGTITSAGAYTAGQTPGAYRVIAKQNGGSLADTSAVTVSEVAPPPPPPPPGPPGTVSNLAVASVTENSVTLSFTEVTDGTGQPARYDVRYAAGTISWGSASSVTQGTCASPVAGTTIGAARTCTVLGLVSSTGYQFQLVAFRGTPNVDAVYGGLSNVASGTTATSTAPVATVTVSPATVSLGVGGTWQLTATLRDASGTVLTGRTITWASSNVLVGTVSGTGLVTAVAAGSATITATSEGQSGSSALTVTLLPPGGPWPNEPAGFTPVTERSFDLLSEAGWGVVGPLALVTDLNAPKSPGLVGQVTYPAGFGGGYEPSFTSVAGIDGRGYTQLYVSFWVKLSSNWQGHSSEVNKIGFVWLHGNPCVFFVPTGSGSGPLEPLIWLQNIPPGGRRLTMNVNPVAFTRGEWHRWEVVLVANTGDLANGEAHWWVDGVKVGEYRDIQYGTSGQSKFWGDELSWRPIWGGIGGTVSETMYMWMDHYYASGK